MGAWKRPPRLRIYGRPDEPSGESASAGWIAGLFLSLCLLVAGLCWLADRMDSDARRRQHERDMHDLDMRQIELKARMRKP